MTRTLRIIGLALAFTWFVLVPSACTDSTTSNVPGNNVTEWQCGSYNGHTLYTGPKGGCYYYNSSGNKTYVDRSYCNC